jgi:thioesterase domain-containing protein
MLEGGATVAGLAALIESGGPEDDRVRQAAEGPGPSVPRLVFIWAGEPAVLALRHLRKRLGSSTPVAALYPADQIVEDDTLSRLADRLLLQLRELQPVGPYALAGFSFGGLLAYEIAGRLAAAGEQVRWLAVLDAPTPAEVLAAARLRARLSRLLDQEWSGRVRQIAGKALGHRRRTVSDEPAATDASAYQNPEISMLLSLVARHTLHAHDVPLELFATDTSIWRYRNLSLGWAQVHLGPLMVNRVSGDHDGMLRLPAVDTLAELMAERFGLAVEGASPVPVGQAGSHTSPSN